MLGRSLHRCNEIVHWCQDAHGFKRFAVRLRPRDRCPSSSFANEAGYYVSRMRLEYGSERSNAGIPFNKTQRWHRMGLEHLVELVFMQNRGMADVYVHVNPCKPELRGSAAGGC